MNTSAIRSLALVSSTFAALVVVLLAALHVLSPEFDPAWRVVSEYANGSHGAALSLMFACWATSSWALALAIRPYLLTTAGKIGIWLLVAAGVDQALACAFDINQPLHGLADLLGGAGFPIAALLITAALLREHPQLRAKKALLLSAHFTWFTVVATIASIAALYFTFVHAGGHVPSDGKSLPLGTVLPHGVIAVVGYANRLMVVADCAWAIAAAFSIGECTDLFTRCGGPASRGISPCGRLGAAEAHRTREIAPIPSRFCTVRVLS